MSVCRYFEIVIGVFSLSGHTNMKKEEIAKYGMWLWLGEMSMTGILVAILYSRCSSRLLIFMRNK
ncbi:MAG: hypothetical protein LUQ07_02865 [Methanospirillum sp.]|nr:hypothetical protein [Methanospirillum sp.]